MSDEEYEGPSWSSDEDDLIDGLDLATSLRQPCVCKECGARFHGPKPFEAGVHDYCVACYKKIQERRGGSVSALRGGIHKRAQVLRLLERLQRNIDTNEEVPAAWIEEAKTIMHAPDLEALVQRYNKALHGIDPKKIGIRVVRFKEKDIAT